MLGDERLHLVPMEGCSAARWELCFGRSCEECEKVNSGGAALPAVSRGSLGYRWCHGWILCVKLAAASARLFGKGEAAFPGDSFAFCGDDFGIADGFSPPQVRKHINDLYEDLRDGHNLISLLEVLSGVKLVSPQGWAGILEAPLTPSILSLLPFTPSHQLSFLPPWFQFQMSVIVSFIIMNIIIWYYIYLCIFYLPIFTQTPVSQAGLSPDYGALGEALFSPILHTFTFQMWLHI